LVREDGFSLIVDNDTSERISISKFRRLHGVRGEMWFYSELLSRLEVATVAAIADDDESLIPPAKHPYARREQERTYA
jgi:hypothetical protein